VTDGAFQLLL